MKRVRKYNSLPNSSKLGILVVILVAGCFSGTDNSWSDTQSESVTVDTFAMEAINQEIAELDSLWKAGNIVLMESGFQRLLQHETEWAGQLDVGEYALLYEWMGEFHYRLGNLTEAQRCNELAILRLDSIEDVDFKTRVWNNRALIESDLGNYSAALALLFKSMDAYGADTVNPSFVDLYNNIGTVYGASGDYDLAIHYFDKHFKLANVLGLEEEYGFYHGNVGYVYYIMGQIERSIPYLQEGKAAFAKHGQFEEELHLNTLLASNYIALGQLEEAGRLLQGSLETAENMQQWEVYVETAISLFEFHIAEGDERTAFAAMERGLEKVHVTNTDRLQLKMFDKLVDYYRAAGDFRNAFTYLRRKISVQDSLTDASKNELMREFSVKYEADRKNDQIARLRLMNAEERRIKAIYFIGLVLLVAILLLIFLLLRRISTQKQAMEETNRTKDRLFSIIAHDLRSPMIALRGMGDLLNHYIDRKDERRLSDLAEKTGKTLTHINHLLDNLLNWAVANSDRIAYNPVEQEVCALVEEALLVHKAGAEAKQLRLVCELAPVAVFVDLNMASSILRNVISNAIKYSPNGGTVTVAGVCSDDYYLIRVRDEGTGIPEEIINRLQQRRGTMVSGGGKDSFGLGLQLAMYFAAANRGKMVFNNQEKGALVEIWLPLVPIKSLTG